MVLTLAFGCGDAEQTVSGHAEGSAPARVAGNSDAATATAAAPTRLHWFIPDGMRADPTTFDVFAWAAEGKLPNIHALMQRGAYGYSVPTFPSHTPTNFATLLTGSFPTTHGVADGPMRVSGHPLARPSVAGFSSTSRKTPAVWSILEQGDRAVALLSVPGSTPPELGARGVTIRGRWGGWGADFASVIFESESSERRRELGVNARLFMLAEELTRFVSTRPPGSWAGPPTSHAPALEVPLEAHGLALVGLLVDSTDDGVVNHDKVAFSRAREAAFATLAPGEWSDWTPATLQWKGTPVDTHVRLHVIALGADGFFRIRMQVDALNRFVTQPAEVAGVLQADVGPMVDYVDSFPAQLIHYPEDRATFLDEAGQSMRWHRDAVDAVYNRYQPDVMVHTTYTPNQMLTSRWWMGAVDPDSDRHASTSDADREARWEEVHALYRQIDDIVGEAVENAGPDAVVVLSSDHGVAPQNHSVRLNNLFAQRGWLTTRTDPSSGAQVVDWAASEVVFLNMYSIFVHPDGLGGDWTRASGPAYDALRDEVVAALMELRDATGQPVVAGVRPWESSTTLHLPADRVGDLMVSNRPGYGWSETVTADHAVFAVPKVAGYKQSLEPGSSQAVWTPFIIAGPGIKAGHRLAEPIRHIDQLPTILTAMGETVPDHVEGRVLTEVMEGAAR